MSSCIAPQKDASHPVIEALQDQIEEMREAHGKELTEMRLQMEQRLAESSAAHHKELADMRLHLEQRLLEVKQALSSLGALP